MKLIIKQKEPTYLRNHRLKTGTDYESFQRDIGKGDIQPPTGFRKFLLEEQGYLCAYCMKRIPHIHVEMGVERDDMKIEHLVPQTASHSMRYKLDITYSNMFACCMGGKGKKEAFETCDTRKKEHFIFINPTNPFNLSKSPFKQFLFHIS